MMEVFHISNRFSRLLFFFALIALAFTYGFVSHWQRVFPYQLIREAYVAFNALLELGEDEKQPGVAFYETARIHEKLAKPLTANAGQENIFVLGGKNTFRDEESDTGVLAWITDRDGNVLHAWKHMENLWSPIENRDVIGPTWRSYPFGAHIFPNGDILVSFQGRRVFPIAMGLAKFDKDSNLLWKRNGFYHHSFSVGPEGEIYTPELIIAESPLQIADHEKFITCENGEFTYDALAILDQNGERTKIIDLLDVLIKSDLAGLFNSNRQTHEEIETCDPMHLNDVRILTEDLADQFPGFSAGDLLLSFRSLNGVGVLDKETLLFKWFYVGAPHHQHSPRFHKDNWIMIFDNYGGSTSRGISRAILVDVVSENIRTVFPQPDAEFPDRPFHSATAGHIDIEPSRKRMLVSWTHQGLIWEIDIDSGDVLWELINTHRVNDKWGRMSVYTAKYVDEISFPLNYGQLR